MLVPSLIALSQKVAACRVTFLLVLFNIAVYGYAGYQDTRAFEVLGHHSFLIDWGATVPALTLSGEYWRLFTSMFLHTSFLHLLINMLALWSIGLVLEARVRWPVFLGIYLVAGLCGSVATTLWNHDVLLVSCGASGAVLGVLGATLVYAFRDKTSIRPSLSLKSLFFSLALTLLAGAFFDLDNAAHLGGVMAGVCLAMVAFYSERLVAVQRRLLLGTVFLSSFVAIWGIMHHYYDAEMSEHIAIARFDNTLGEMGLLHADRELVGARLVDSCIDDALTQASNTDAVLRALRQCDTKLENQYQFLLKVFMPLKYQRCHTEIAALSRKLTDPATVVALKGINRYCGVQATLYTAVFTDEPVELNVDDAVRMRLLARFLLNQDRRYRTESKPLIAQSRAIRRLLNSPTPLARAIVRASGCPYWSCER